MSSGTHRPSIVIDFDGTLFDAEAYLSGLRDCVKPFGISKESWQSAVTKASPNGILLVDRLVEQLAAKSSRPASEIRRAIDRETLEAVWYLHADARPFLDRFKGQAKLHLVSLGCRQLQRQKLDAVELEPYFDSVTVLEAVDPPSSELPVSPVDQAIFINDDPKQLLEFARTFRWANHIHIQRTGAKPAGQLPFTSYPDLRLAAEAVEQILAAKSQA